VEALIALALVTAISAAVIAYEAIRLRRDAPSSA
jgi:hypothetical protein